MIRFLKRGLLFIALFLAFLILTFPFERLGPRLGKELEKGLKGLDRAAKCEVIGFDVKLPLRVVAASVTCRGTPEQPLLNLKEVRASVWPWGQSVQANLGKGSLSASINAGVFSSPSRVQVAAERVSLEDVSPLIGISLSRINPFLPSSAKLSGLLSGSGSIPLKNFHTSDGEIDFNIQNLKLPEQNLLQSIGLREIPFSKSSAKARIQNGKLSIQEIAALSPVVSGKVEGQMELAENLPQSTGSLFLKWKVERSDALLNSPIGAGLANAPCPSPDSEGFCTRRINRLSELIGPGR